LIEIAASLLFVEDVKLAVSSYTMRPSLEKAWPPHPWFVRGYLRGLAGPVVGIKVEVAVSVGIEVIVLPIHMGSRRGAGCRLSFWRNV
jgi:hypothetical protein